MVVDQVINIIRNNFLLFFLIMKNVYQKWGMEIYAIKIIL